MKFAFIKESLREYPVEICCQVLGVSRAGYYAWRDRPASERSVRRQQLKEKIKAVHEQNRRVYWLYLAGVIDLCSRMIVGWSMAEHMRTDLVGDALKMAIARRNPTGPLIHHSDRGVQYTCEDYMHLLESHNLQPSMSRKGNCWDNAMKESFWATLKTERVNHERYLTHDQARASIFEYIEVFYNRKRLHSSLGYVSPEQFEASLN